MTARKHTRHVCLSVPQVSPLTWENCGSLSFAWATRGSLPSVQICRPYIVFSSPMRKYEHSLCLTYFSVYGSLSELKYLHFFPVICWSSLWTEISVTQFIGNKLYSRHHILYFSYRWKPLCWYYFASALNLRSSSPAKQVYYTMGQIELHRVFEGVLFYHLNCIFMLNWIV